MRSKLIRVVCVAVALAVLPLQAAKACSCGPLDPRDAFESSDGAFVGTFIESRLADPPGPGEPFSSGADTIYSFTLDEEYKGELGEPGDVVEVHSPYSGASCGLEVQPGQDYGLFLDVRERDGAWTSSLCAQVSPETMRRAARPLPKPNGEGPPRMLLGGSFGRAQVMSLDARGRTLAYGFGGREVVHVDACPGSRRSVEIAQTYPEPPVLVVRELPTLDVIRKVELPMGRRQKFPRQDAAALGCRTQFARNVVVFSTSYREPEATSMLLRIKGPKTSVLHRGSGRAAVFGNRHAFLTSGDLGRDLVKVSLRTGRERHLARLPALYQDSLSLSPDGMRLAGFARPHWDDMETEPTLFYTVKVAGGDARVRTRSLGRGEVYGHSAWISRRRPVAFIEYAGGSRVFDLRLRVVSRFGNWPGRRPVIVGRTAYAPGWGGETSSLLKVRLPHGEVRSVRKLPSPIAYAITEVP